MTLRKAVFDITVATGGEIGSDDVLMPATVDTRTARLESVTIEPTVGGAGRPNVTIYELDTVGTDEFADATETLKLGRQLFHIGLLGESAAAVDGELTFYPRRNAVDAFGGAQGVDAGDGRVHVRAHRARCFVDNASGGDAFTITMYYETAGDQRF